MLHVDGGTSATTRLLGNTHSLLLILQSGAKPKASHKPGRVGRRRENDASRIFGDHCPGRIDKLRIAQERVEVRSINASVKLEEMIYGHLTELNGKYKMRATEVTFELGGFLGAHHHVGPAPIYPALERDVGPQPQDQRN